MEVKFLVVLPPKAFLSLKNRGWEVSSKTRSLVASLIINGGKNAVIEINTIIIWNKEKTRIMRKILVVSGIACENDDLIYEAPYCEFSNYFKAVGYFLRQIRVIENIF